MFIDTRSLDENTVITTTVCIIGGGVAGITLALEMEKAGIPAVLLEGGSFRSDRGSQDICEGENVGLPYEFGDGYRSRFLGGCSNCWGGWCRPLDAHEFAQREWVPYSGWPIGKQDLDPYYERARDILEITLPDWDPAWWEAQLERPDLKFLPWDSGDILNIISQFSPPTRMGNRYRKALAKARFVDTYLNANVVDFVTENPAHTVLKAKVKTLSGRHCEVAARLFILATGGIENARLLLAANTVQGCGLGNGRDLVGRFFADHPRLKFGQFRPINNGHCNKSFDIKFCYLNSKVSVKGQRFAGHFAFPEQVLTHERMLATHATLESHFFGEDTDAMWALIYLKHLSLRQHVRLRKEAGPISLRKIFVDILTNPLDASGFAGARLFGVAALIKYLKLTVIVEPVPNPDSRVMLSEDCKDALGMPRAKVAWHLTDLEKHTFDRAVALLAEGLRRQNIYTGEFPEQPLMGREWPADLQSTWHHMGTTRMHDSPSQGVVDRNCLIHDMTNLYVAGSSVFPSYGANFPTFTLTALALRLADHLVAKLRKSEGT